ncbi:E3 ubiquitin-protein ligase TRIM71-like [Watersipora subatra]|uniref:E3 ubiquitin-protein ligase TRIM71-like n=1 Tax=Watersipora subatra TaxID=2589382 RepID=UPI00355BEDE2
MDKWVRCSGCLQELSNLRDPRELPCSHIFCASCVQSNSQQVAGVRCPVCGHLDDEVNVESLPKPETDKLDIGTKETPTCDPTCSRCEDSSLAVRFCLRCVETICDKHFQLHQEYFNESHLTISISEFVKNPGQYTYPMCSEHVSREISQVCKTCLLLACSDCVATTVCIKGKGCHQFQTLAGIADSFKKEFTELLTACSDKVTEICKLEKETWLTLDSIIAECHEMVQNAQKNMEDQIEQIKESTSNLIKQIYDYQEDRTARAEVFVSGLMEKRETLENLQSSVRQLLADQSVVEIAKQKEEKTAALSDFKDMQIGKCEWQEQVLVSYAAHRKTELRLIPSLSSLNFSFFKSYTTVTGNLCRSVTFSSGGEPIVACDRFIDQCYTSMEKKFHSKSFSNIILSLAWMASGNLLVLRNNGSILITSYPYSSYTTELVQAGARRITVSEHSIYILSDLDAGSKITEYNLSTKVQRSYTISDARIVSICYLRDGSIMAVSQTAGDIRKYRLYEGEQVVQQWKCEGLTGAYAVCADKKGFAYVAAGQSKIYIVAYGKVHRTLMSKQLQECTDPSIGDIAIYDNILAVVRCGMFCFDAFSLQ